MTHIQTGSTHHQNKYFDFASRRLTQKCGIYDFNKIHPSDLVLTPHDPRLT